MNHSFDIKIAKDVGIEAAIILDNMYFWIEKNEANDKHSYDGSYWTYNSISAYTAIFPYMSENTIRYAIKKLKDSGYVVTGNYNKVAYDRTIWYSITEYGREKLGVSICKKSQMDLGNNSNGFDKNPEPIPDIKPSGNQNIKLNRGGEKKKEDGSDEIDHFTTFWTLYPRKEGKKQAEKKYTAMLKAGKEPGDIIKSLNTYVNQIKARGTEDRFIKHPATFLNNIEDYPLSNSLTSSSTDMPPPPIVLDESDRGERMSPEELKELHDENERIKKAKGIA